MDPSVPLPVLVWEVGGSSLDVSVIPLLSTITLVCTFNSSDWDNGTVYTHGNISHYHFFANDTAISGFYTNTAEVTISDESFLLYQCQIALYEENTMNLLHSNYSDPLGLDFGEPCENDGKGVLNATGLFCECVFGFDGPLCEMIASEALAHELDINDESNAKASVDSIFRKANDIVAHHGNRMTSSSAEVVSILTDKITSSADWSPETLATVTDSIMGFVDNTFATVRTQGGSDTVYDKMEDSLFSLSAVILNSNASSGSGDNGVEMTTGNITLNMNTLTSDHPSIQAVGAIIHVSDTTGNKQALAITYEASPYPATGSDPNGKVINFKVQDTDGSLINVTSDPVTLTFSTTTPLNEFNPNVSSSYNMSLAGVDPEMFLVVEVNVSSEAKLTIQARLDGIPSSDVAEVNVKVTSESVEETRNLLNVNFVTKVSETTMAVKMYGKNLTLQGNYLLVFLRDDTGKTNEIILTAFTMDVLYWDTSQKVWIRSEETNATKISEDSGVVFTSNIFGSFSVSSFFITPVPIDFEDVFGNFQDNVADSPYVLTLVCLIVAGLVIGIVLLRREDRRDAVLWTYLPLVDNDPSQKWVYTLSVYTGVASPKAMSSTPFFVMYGEHTNTGIRTLHDGIRRNFASGTVSNFVMTSPDWLGDVMMVKLWTDGLGTNPDWCLDRVVVVDMATSSRYVFLCRDWFSLLKSGTLCHTLPPLHKEAPPGGGLALVSRERLYEDHMWLSMTKRPSYSTFTRVQRLVVVTSLLSLTMLTNAMFFQSSEDMKEEDEKPTGLRLGPVTVSYKQIYVGVVSGFIVVVPSILLAWIFSNRQQHQQRHPPSSPHTDSSDETGSTFDSVVTTTTTVTTHNASVMTSRTTPATPILDSNPDVLVSYEGKLTAAMAPISTKIFGNPGTGKPKKSNIIGFPINEEDKNLQKWASILTPVEVPESVKTTKKSAGIHAFTSDGKVKMNPKSMVDSFMSTLIQECERSQAISPQPTKVPRLPWWSIFVGYVIAGILLSIGLFLTFLYSLQWGGDKSLDWLLSLVFSTSSSAFIFEPVKIILLCVIISYTFTRLVSSSLKDVAPYDNNDTTLGPMANRPDVCPPPEVNDQFFVKRKRELSLQQRWHEILRSIGVRAGLVVLFCVLCLHSDIHMSYLENNAVHGLFNDTHAGRSINTMPDVYPWLRDIVINQSMPVSYANGDSLPADLVNFTNDLAHYRLGPLKVIQFRVQDKCSHAPEDLSEYFRDISCWVDYSGANEETRDFGQNWTSCNHSCPTHFSHTTSSDHCISMEGDVAIYGPNGYQVLLDSDRDNSLDIITALETNNWLDHLTRGVLVELMTFNPNTRLFSQAKVLLETASFGGVLQTSFARSARLYPYVSVWDYFVLVAQCIVIMTVVVRSAMLVSSIVLSKGKSLWNPTVIVACLELLVSWCAVCVFIARIHYTITVLERIVNERGEFTSFDVVLTLDFVYLACISSVLFLRMLLFLEPLKLNFYFYIMRQTIRSSMAPLLGYGVLIVGVLTAFASFFYMCRGSVTSNLKSMPRAYVSLLTVLLGHGKYRVVGGQHDEAGSPTGLDEIFFRVMYGIFSFAAAIWMVNVAVTILTSYMTEVTSYTRSRSVKKGGYDKHLNVYLWSQIDKLIETVFKPTLTPAQTPGSEGLVQDKQDAPAID